VDIIPDFWFKAGEPSHSDLLRVVVPMTLENWSRKNKTFFKPDSPTSNCAPVTIERSSSDSTGAVQIWEKLFHFTFS
jgi:hypothetical protein